MKKIIFLLGFMIAAGVVHSADSLSEKTFRQDMSFYEKTAKAKKLGANDRLYILERLRQKYSGTDFDLSPLYAQIDHWYGIRLKEKGGTPAPEKPAAKAPQSHGTLSKILVTDSPEFSRVIFSLAGNSEYKDEVKKDERGTKPPVILLYLYNTRDMLNPASRSFAVKNGLVRQVQVQTLPGKPPALKVQIALRDDTPYQISKEEGQIILTLDKAVQAQAPAEPVPTSPVQPDPLPVPLPAPAVAAVEISSPVTVTIMGAVKTQGPLKVKEGTKLMEAVYLAGGFEDNARMDKIRIVRQQEGKKVTMTFSAEEAIKKNSAKDVVLMQGDLVMVPEKSSMKDKALNGKVVPWATFFISMGLVLALLI